MMSDKSGIPKGSLIQTWEINGTLSGPNLKTEKHPIGKKGHPVINFNHCLLKVLQG